MDAASGRRLGSVRVGASASDITTDGRDLWIALARADKVVRVRASDGQVVRGFGLPKPTALVATARSIWVATRTTVPGRPDVLVRVDRQTGARTQFPIPAGIAALAISSGKVWIGARTAETVSYLDTADGALHPIPHGVGGRPVDLFVARGVVWVSTRKGIARIAIGAGHQTLTAALPAPVRPGQIAAVGDRAFLADTAASRVLPFDANTLRAAGNPIDVGVNPYAVTLAGHDLFVAGKGDGSLTRVGLSG